ncbi:MAG: class I SAM-dependent methyltransferase [Candidatus Omnitrophica bacterium]|nr:class I SAM-dependent methyltransferase [Candidatus Omnitrophota bacterium]
MSGSISSSPSFTTSSGVELRRVEGYGERAPRVTARDVLAGYEDPDGWVMGIDRFVKDVYEYAVVMDFLASLGLPMRWARALEIGGAEGTIARLLRGQGVARHVTVVELKDLSRKLPTAQFLNYWARFRAAAAAAAFSPRLRRVLIGEAAWRGKRLSPLFNSFGYLPPRGSVFWRPVLRRAPVIDRYLVRDLFTLQESFDLITAFLCLSYFDPDRLFAKVSAALEEGGVFAALADSWWYPVNSTFIAGDFPYACQRMTEDDFARYVAARHPDQAQDWLERYRAYHQGKAHPTINEYVERADRHDLALLGVRPLLPPHDTDDRAGLSPRLLNQFEESRLSRIAEEIRRFRPDIGLVDLMTRYVVLAFQKRTRTGGTLAEHLSETDERW